MTYQERYGDWAGNPRGRAPDLTRCCVEIHPSTGFRVPYQCNRKRGHRPDNAYCKQHSPEAVAARDKAAKERYEKQSLKWKYETYGKMFHDVLKQIADGHNDPRSLAIETLKVMKR